MAEQQEWRGGDDLTLAPGAAGLRLLGPAFAQGTGVDRVFAKSIMSEFPKSSIAGFAAASISSQVLESQARIADSFRSAIADSIGRSAISSVFADSISTSIFGLDRYLEDFKSSAMLAFASSLKSPLDGMFRSQFLQITSALESVNRFALNEIYLVISSGLRDTLIRYGQTQANFAEVAFRAEMPPLLRGASLGPGNMYDAYLDSLPARPITRRAAVAQHAGSVQAGLVIAEGLTAPGLRVTERDTLAGSLEDGVLEPWLSGPSDARIELFTVLEALESDLPDWLRGAWDDIVRDGPKAASKVANCAVECIDRALRAASPNPELLSWLQGRSVAGELLHDGAPTRRARVMFIMRDRSARDTRLAAAQVEALVSLIQNVVADMQSVKHGEAPTIAVMRCWLLAAEAALSQLFLQV